MEETCKVIIIGGGLAGLTAGIHLSKIGIAVVIVEKNTFPKHKVCGEYISNEVIPYLQWLGIHLENLHPTNITKLEFSTPNGKTIRCNLPLGGFGISRYTLDDVLYKKAIANGCTVIHETVENVNFKDNIFTVITSQNKLLKSSLVIGAFGKRSNIDQKLNRSFILQKSPWLAVKAHYQGSFPDNIVGLHNFKGGYCGVSKVEDNKINICYLADYETFKKHKNIATYQQEVVAKNSNMKAILENCSCLFEQPLTISQISFEPKQAVESNILMIGDTSGLIHPLCGNGMAMAIHSAKIVSELLEEYTQDKIDRTALEKKYTQQWDFYFSKRIKAGRYLSSLLQKQKLASFLMELLVYFPFLLPMIIKRTHGKPITLSQ